MSRRMRKAGEIIRMMMWVMMAQGVMAAEGGDTTEQIAAMTMGAVVSVMCVTMNVNGIHMEKGKEEGKEEEWKPDRKLRKILMRAREGKWAECE